MINTDRIVFLINEYDEARRQDSIFGEAYNSGNVMGDLLVEALKEELQL